MKGSERNRKDCWLGDERGNFVSEYLPGEGSWGESAGFVRSLEGTHYRLVT